MKFLFVLLTILCVKTVSQAAESRACLFEGRISGNSVKDCMYVENMAEADFKKMCSAIAQAGNSLGGSAKVTYSKECPASPQGICSMVRNGITMKSYYYKRPVSILDDTKRSCIKSGGTWSK